MSPVINLSTKTTAERLGLSQGTLRNWRCQGRGPAYVKVGSRVVYPLWAIEAFEAANLVEPIA